jgi:hypothetical protein
MNITETTPETQAALDEERTRIANEQVAPRRLPERRKDPPAASGDPFCDPSVTHGKNGVPPLWAQPDPQAPPTAKRGRPRKTKAPSGGNADLTEIVYSTASRKECGGQIVDRQQTQIIVNNGLALISIPTSEEGRTWIYRHVFEESTRLGAKPILSPARITIIPGTKPSAVKDTWLDPPTAPPVAAPATKRPGTPKPPTASASDLPHVVWQILDLHIEDLITASADHNLRACRDHLAHLNRLFSILPVTAV